MRETFTSGSVGRAPGNRCLYPEPDCLQPPLRCGFRQQVSLGVGRQDSATYAFDPKQPCGLVRRQYNGGLQDEHRSGERQVFEVCDAQGQNTQNAAFTRLRTRAHCRNAKKREYSCQFGCHRGNPGLERHNQ